jgi:hypothetical protein
MIAQCFAVELRAGLLAAIQQPVTGAHTVMGVDQTAAEGQHECEGVLPGGDGADAGGVHDDDAALGGGVDVDADQPAEGRAITLS